MPAKMHNFQGMWFILVKLSYYHLLFVVRNMVAMQNG